MSADTTQTQPPSKYDKLIAAAKAVPPVPTIVVHPCDETSLRGAVDSAQAQRQQRQFFHATRRFARAHADSAREDDAVRIG